MICNKTTDKLNVQLQKHLSLKLSRVERAYVGHLQRSLGAWSWFGYIVDEDGDETDKTCGSQYTIKEIIKAKYLSLCNDFTICVGKTNTT